MGAPRLRKFRLKGEDQSQKRQQRGLDRDVCSGVLQASTQAGTGGGGGISICEAGSW